jgi:uncharacterized protein (DUF433 family)
LDLRRLLRYDQLMEHLSSHETQRTSRTEHIVSTPGVCGGKPRIADSRIRVQDIVVWYEAWGLSPEEIVTDFPQLTLAQVHAALAYYHDHQDEIRQHMKDAEALAETFKQQYPSKVFELRSHDVLDDNAPLSPG